MGQELLSKYLEDTSIQQYKTDVAFRTLVEGVDENMYIIPSYQRKFRWKKYQVENLVESLLKGLPIPPIYTYRNEKKQLVILDGQQRVMSLFFYYIGYFLNEKDNSSIDFSRLELNGRTFKEALLSRDDIIKLDIKIRVNENEALCVNYHDLPIEVKRKVDYTTITVIEIKIDQDEGQNQVLKKIFANLNNGGSILSDQEIRNGIYNCAMYEMLHKFNHENGKWRSLWGRESAEEKDLEMLLRLCAMKKYVDVKGGEFTISNYHSSYSDLLDQFSEEALNFDINMVDRYKAALEEFVNYFDVRNVLANSVSLLESIFVVFEKRGIKKTITSSMLDEIRKLPGFTNNTRQGTVKMKKMNERWKAVYDYLSRTD